MSTRVIRACDGCRVRKVRCNGEQPCSQCAHLSLACKFAPPPAKRKPGVRGRLVAQLRNSQQAAQQDHHRHNHHRFQPDSSHSSKTSPTTTSTSVPSSSSPASDTSPPAVTSIAGIVNADPSHADAALSSLPATPSHAGSPHSGAWPHHTVDYFLSYLALYDEHIYPVNPVLTCAEMRAAIRNMDADLEDRALVYAFAAVTINLTQTLFTTATDTLTEIATLMNLSMQVHRQAETRRDNSTAWTSPDAGPSAASVKFGELFVTFRRIMTCVFLEICMMAFKRWDRSLMLLREAITMIQILNVHQYDDTIPFDGSRIKDFDSMSNYPTAAEATIHAEMRPRDVFRLRRVYWELFIHERFLTTVTGYPCVQHALAAVPLHDPTIPPHVDLGFSRLVNLFRVLDGPFLAHWTAHKDPSLLRPPLAASAGNAPEKMTAHWIESKQSELDRDEEGAALTEQRLAHVGGGGRGRFTEVQHVDLFVTRVWLRTLVWQFALHHGLLRSAPPRDTHEGMSLHFPAQRLSSQLRALVARLENLSSIVTHGSGILQKLFEITSTVADVLALPMGPGQTEEEARARLEDFEFMVRFLFSFERIEKTQRDYLREKLGVLGQQYTIVDFAKLAGESPNA